jgi:hypothetical protein
MKITLLFCLIFLSCNNARKAYDKNKNNQYWHPWLIAWNEDTMQSVKFRIDEDLTFKYLLETKDSNKITKLLYYGKYKYARDTFFLQYRKGRRPANFTDYVIIEASGGYLIQCFTNKSQRLFMRKHPLNLRPF